VKDEITYRGVVHPWHCDHMGHMNGMWYVGKFDEATWNLSPTWACRAPDCSKKTHRDGRGRTASN
jgi:hypothetical protein